MKRLLKITLAVVVFLLVSGVGGYFYARQKFRPPVNQLTITGLPATCAFAWLADTTFLPVVPHRALLVPVTLPNCSRICYMQFDTGAPYTLLYSNPLNALQARYPALRRAIAVPADTLRNFRFNLGESQVLMRRIPVRSNMGASSLPADSTALFIIGTLGTDALDGRVLVLDYVRQQFQLASQVPDTLVARTTFVPLEFDSRRLMLQAQVQGEVKQLLFDSGSSAFALLTNPDTYRKLARPGAQEQTASVNSWGKKLTSHTIPTAAVMQVGAATLPLRTASYMEGMNWWQKLLMSSSGMSGMLGNEPFSRHTIVVDVAGGRFGVVKN
jgi:hypothetical protein